jgi:hypothetical protein
MYKIKWLFSLGWVALIPLAAEARTDTVFKAFGVRTAIVNYEMNGSRVLTKESNLSIRGNSALLFSEWGARRLYKEKYTESTEGPVRSSEVVRTLYRNDFGDLYRVDFEKAKIRKSEDKELKEEISTHENLYLKKNKLIKSEGKWLGYLKISGYICDNWLYRGKELCLYKGVPLREEMVLSGVNVLKQAVSAKFDLNITEDAFAFPDLKKEAQEGYLLKESVGEIGKRRSEEVDTGAPATEEEKVDKDGKKKREALFRQQKILLPKLLETMKETRICLDNAEYVEEANQCLSKMLELKEKIGSVPEVKNEITSWSKNAREKTLDELDDGILEMRRKMPCIRRSQKFEDLAKCIKDPEKDPL